MKIDLRNNKEKLEELKKSNREPIAEQEAKTLAMKINAVKYIECSALSRVSYKRLK